MLCTGDEESLYSVRGILRMLETVPFRAQLRMTADQDNKNKDDSHCEAPQQESSLYFVLWY